MRSRLVIVRMSKFWAARLRARGQPHDAHTLDRAHFSGKRNTFPHEAGGAGRVVVSARESARRTARRRRSCLGATAIWLPLTLALPKPARVDRGGGIDH